MDLTKYIFQNNIILHAEQVVGTQLATFTVVQHNPLLADCQLPVFEHPEFPYHVSQLAMQLA